MQLTHSLRKAVMSDCALLQALIARSINALGAGDYSAEQIEAALRGAFGVDRQLIADGTYYVGELETRIVACGGWSRRRTLFGGDAHAVRDATELDPAHDAARIRAFFVDPSVARQGFGSALLARCEADAAAHGFQRFELMATLPGSRLYAARGYVGGAPVFYRLGPALSIEFIPMTKSVSQ
jgi:GNAT superfamily N-acetyltransferase